MGMCWKQFFFGLTCFFYRTINIGWGQTNFSRRHGFLMFQSPSAGPKYIFADSFVRHQAKEREIGSENNWWGKLWVSTLNKHYKT